MNDHPDPGRTAPEAEGQLVLAAPAPAALLPAHVGRYRVERLLGEGGFGRVYLARDEQLQRSVAVKVPHPHLVAGPRDAGAYLAEARTAAGLDHPHIVPVFDVGGTPEFPCFIVSKFIAGRTLAETIRHDRPAPRAAAALVAAVADALQHAHQHGVVHRDVKPGNVLLDSAGRPFVADFGLALREQDVGQGPRYAGTPAYMSPEQARGEGHRVDGRTDVFSLGAVFYELLTGRRPFQAGSREELLEQIATHEPRPPRQWDDTVPKELERICLKALAKRAAERYTTARDLADDLRHFLAAQPAAPAPTAVGGPGASPRVPAPATPTPTALGAPEADPASPTAPASDGSALKVVPKGLRPFDAHDADFFLELLPGPRDREGLPDSVRFWKARIEETDPDNTFAVGLIYGPSGCGKSSLVRAGLLPRLSDGVIAVYVEATGQETEARLLNGLRKRCPALPAHLGLKEALAALRRGQGLPAGKKVLLVLDQFEQWLHGKRSEPNTELVQALRHCDGERVQCLVLVRDDFWLAVSRFLGDVEVELVQGHNVALVDLFDPRHAKKVLAAFGRAFGALPESTEARTEEQEAFLDQAVAGLSQEGKVISVRLALFAEMVKGKPWTPAALKEVGGMEGVGVTFLEETFAASTAPPQHRRHQRAAQAVLKALLPETGTDIKGNMRSQQELLAASGYDAQPRAFDALLRILDGELRLLTPTDPEGAGAEGPQAVPTAGGGFYQLTHDYLVPSLRDWLNRKQRETRRGRAELRLAERAALWHVKPESRFLPAWWEWLHVRLLTRRGHWTEPQRKMMRKAARHHGTRGLALTAGLLLLLAAGWEGFGRLRARALLDNLLRAPTEEVPGIVKDMAPYRRWLDAPLRDRYAEAEANEGARNDSRKQLHASLALLPVDPGQVGYLQARLLTAEPREVVVLREALRPHAATLTGPLWGMLEDGKQEAGKRLRAACALAEYTPDDRRWEGVSGDVAARLVTENAFAIGQWANALRPVRKSLLPVLAGFLMEEGRGASERRTITGLYADYAKDSPAAIAHLNQALAEEIGPQATPEGRLARARRQANTAVALAALGRWEKTQPLLRHGPDPTLRSYLIDRLGPGGVEARELARLLGQEKDDSIRRAIVLSLGEFDRDRLPPSERESLIARFVELYRDDADPGVHGAVGWLLRKWGQQEKLEEIDRGLATGKVEGKRRWYVNHEGQTMVVVPPPGEFWVGPPGEFGGGPQVGERHRRRIDRGFVLAARGVTVGEFLRFRKQGYLKPFAPTPDCPMIAVSWYDAAAYCNWLSKEAGAPEDQWCYAPDAKGEYGAGMKVVAGYLGKTGYRLPTEAEREYACRAGSETHWFFGADEGLLGRYAWFTSNSAGRPHPVGTLRPNDLGLFDLHGNVWEWCQDRHSREWPPKGEGPIEDKDDVEDIVDEKSGRVFRGGSIEHGPLLVNSWVRDHFVPSRRYLYGFRPARTFR